MRNLSEHARQRCDQRGIDNDHIALALEWGADIDQHDGRTAFHLGRREADLARRQGVLVPESAVGVGVVVAADGTLITAVRSGDRHRLAAHGWRPARRRGARGRP